MYIYIFGGLWRLSPQIAGDALLILAQIIIQRCDENSCPTNTAYIRLQNPKLAATSLPCWPCNLPYCDVLP